MIAQRDGEVATPEIARPRVPHEVTFIIILVYYWSSACNYLTQNIFRFYLLSEDGVVDRRLLLLKLTTLELTVGLKYGFLHFVIHISDHYLSSSFTR